MSNKMARKTKAPGRVRRACKNAPDDLSDDMIRIIEMLNDEQIAGIKARWEIGNCIKDFNERYGSFGFKKLKSLMSEDPSSLLKFEMLANTYTKADIDELTNLRMSDGLTTLSYGHLRLLVTLQTREQRQYALEETLKNCWTSTQLAAYIRDLQGEKKERKQSTPKSFKALVEQQKSFAEDFDNRNYAVWRNPNHSLTTQLAKIDPSEYNQEIENDLATLAHRMQQIAKEAAERAEEAITQYENVSKVLNTGHAQLQPK